MLTVTTLASSCLIQVYHVSFGLSTSNIRICIFVQTVHSVGFRFNCDSCVLGPDFTRPLTLYRSCNWSHRLFFHIDFSKKISNEVTLNFETISTKKIESTSCKITFTSLWSGFTDGSIRWSSHGHRCQVHWDRTILDRRIHQIASFKWSYENERSGKKCQSRLSI